MCYLLTAVTPYKQTHLHHSTSSQPFPRGSDSSEQKWQNWELGKFSKGIPKIPRHQGSFQVPWGNSPNSHVEENFQNFSNKPPQIPEENLESFQIPFLGKSPKRIHQISRHLESSQVPWGNSPNSHVEGNVLNFKNIPPQIPEGNLGSSLIPFLRKFPKGIPQILRHWEVPKFLCLT